MFLKAVMLVKDNFQEPLRNNNQWALFDIVIGYLKCVNL